MKKLILLIFLLSFSNAKAISNNVFDFNNSLDIGNYMVENYTRWVCENYQCKETNKKTDGDFGTKSECEKACKKTSLNTSLNTNQDIFTSFKSPTTTTKANYQSYTNGNLFDYSNDNLFNYTITSTKPIKDYLSIDNIQNSFTTMTTKGNITSVIDGLGFDTSLANPEVKTSTSPINSFFQNILKGLGFDRSKDDIITNTDLDKNEIGIETETTRPEGYIWANKCYAFKINNLNPDEIKNKDNNKLDISVDLRIAKNCPNYLLGSDNTLVLYSYIDENNKRRFNSFTEETFASTAEDNKDAYYSDHFIKEINIPNDIRISNDNGEIEIITLPGAFDYKDYISEENDYSYWRNTEKFTISFDYKEGKKGRFDFNVQEDEDYIWYYEDYAFLIKSTSSTNKRSIDNPYLNLNIKLKLKKSVKEKMTDVGILYSYINKKGERIFDSFDKKVTIPAKNDDLKYYNYDFEKTITIPRDINVSNDIASIEFFAVVYPNYYSRYTNKEDNYSIWEETKKSIIVFNYNRKEDYEKDIFYGCKFSIVNPQPKSNFIDGQDPYYSNFKLAIKMECDIDYEDWFNSDSFPWLEISYQMDCPNHFNTDWKSKDNINYSSIFLNGYKEFPIGSHINWTKDGVKIAAILNLEETTLIDILLNKKVQTNPKNKNTTTPRSFGLSKKCDIGVQIKRNQHNQHPGVSLKDYFYLNQVKVKVVNEHPEWIYCTEDRNGDLLPIKPKLTFSGKRDNDYSITNVEFAIYPDPYDEESTIYDTKIGPHFFSNDNWADKKENGQIMYPNLNRDRDTFDYYFKTGLGIDKNQAKWHSNLTFAPLTYDVEGNNLFYNIPNENITGTESFKVYYGWKKECGNAPIYNTPPIKNNIVINTLSIIGNFFKSLFK